MLYLTIISRIVLWERGKRRHGGYSLPHSAGGGRWVPLYGRLAGDGPHGGGLRRHGHHRHNLPGDGPKNYGSAALRTGFSRLRQALEQEGIPLRIHPGAEVFCTPELPELLDRRQLQTLGGGRYLLVEFYFDESAEFMEQCFHQIRTRGLTPVAAHPERYDAVQRDPYIIRRWFEGGVVIQLNKGSILGRLGRRAQDTALWLLERGLAHAAASDAHSPTVRTTHMELLRRTLAEDFSPACPRLLLEENPRRILEDRPLVGTDEPIFSPREDEL